MTINDPEIIMQQREQIKVLKRRLLVKSAIARLLMQKASSDFFLIQSLKKRVLDLERNHPNKTQNTGEKSEQENRQIEDCNPDRIGSSRFGG